MDLEEKRIPPKSSFHLEKGIDGGWSVEVVGVECGDERGQGVEG
jgi:hypothetical protein